MSPVMRSSVKLGRAEQGDVVGFSQVLHELGDELLGRQTSKPSVLGRNDHVKASVRIRHDALCLEAAERGSYRRRGAPKRHDRFLGREVVPPRSREGIKVGCSVGEPIHCSQNVIFRVALRKRWIGRASCRSASGVPILA